MRMKSKSYICTGSYINTGLDLDLDLILIFDTDTDTGTDTDMF